jgi:hypothetical protein
MSSRPRESAPKNRPPELDFDVTQDIEPWFPDLNVSGGETTLTEIDFENIGLAYDPRRPRAARRAPRS